MGGLQWLLVVLQVSADAAEHSVTGTLALHQNGEVVGVAGKQVPLFLQFFVRWIEHDVLVHQLAILLAASFRPNLAVKPLPFASSYRLLATRFSTVFFLQRTFTSLVHAHAGRTQGH